MIYTIGLIVLLRYILRVMNFIWQRRFYFSNDHGDLSKYAANDGFAVITGATGGLGKQISEHLASRLGWIRFLWYREIIAKNPGWRSPADKIFTVTVKMVYHGPIYQDRWARKCRSNHCVRVSFRISSTCIVLYKGYITNSTFEGDKSVYDRYEWRCPRIS